MASGDVNIMRSFWIEVIQKIGIPTAGLIFVSYALWHVGTNFIQPMYEKQVKLIDRLDESVATISQAVEANAAADVAQTKLLDELADISSNSLSEIKRAADAAQSHSSKLDKIAEEINKGGGS
jgi:hypothetical protein